MEKNKPIGTKFKEFALSTIAVNNRKTVYLVLAILLIGGISSYQNMSREAFPEIQIPEIYVNVPYPGNSPEIVRDKIIKPLEKELNTIAGIDEIKSTAIQDFGIINIKFDFSISPDEAKDLVEEAYNDAKTDKRFAKDLPLPPTIAEMDITSMPIINLNLSGDYPVQYLNNKAEYLEDLIEAIPEISGIEIRGVQDRKLKIEVNKFKAEAAKVSFQDIEAAIQNDNLMMGAGNMSIDGIDHFVVIDGKLNSIDKLKQLVVKHEDNDDVFLHEVADISFGDTDTTSFARQSDNPVVMIDIKKRSGANVINAIDKVKMVVEEVSEDGILDGINYTYTNDQSNQIRSQVSNLENSIIFGVILVVAVLLFFLGLRNALFVGVAIPLSMFMSFMLLHYFGVTLNIMVLFSLVLALGMLVDNGIVVVENIYRLMDEEGMDSFEAAKKGVGEVAWPIIASTATTLAVFIPLALWPGIMGEFMQYLPITLMIVLGSSLFIALVVNPVLTAVLMKTKETPGNHKRTWTVFGIFLLLGIISYGNSTGMGNLFSVFALLVIINRYLLLPATRLFQNRALPKLENFYMKFLTSTMKGKRALYIFIGTFALLIMSFVLMGLFPPKVLFFPDNEPNYLNIYVEHPAGTGISVTNQTTKEVKDVIDAVLDKERLVGNKTISYSSSFDTERKNLAGGSQDIDTIRFIESIIEQVGKGTSDPMEGPSFGETPHKARITVSFTEFSHRKGLSTGDVMKAIEDSLRSWPYADVKIIVGKEPNGPPQAPPINIEITGSDKYRDLVIAAEKVQAYLNDQRVEGAPLLSIDVKLNKAEINIELDREYLRTNGMSTGQIASTIRTALFGKDVSTYEYEDDSYDLNVRLGREFRGGIDDLLDQKIMFMNNKGQKLNIPIRSVVKDVKVNYTNSSIKRLDLVNVVTVFSGVEQGANANEVVDAFKAKMKEFEKTEDWKMLADSGIEYTFTGQMEEQAKEMAFLSKALLIAVFLILLIIVTQFNSFSTPTIILLSVVLSLVGVFMGIVIAQDDFIVIMTMIGIISLAGIVVNNAIVLVDYTNLLRKRKRDELGLSETVQLPVEEIKNAIILGGKTRLRPVLLTAITTILGLLPMATGMNIDFFSLFSEFDPKIFFGGDNAMFFGPMSWTIIYGLTFATFLTLVVVPSMYYLLYRLKVWMYRVFRWELKSNI
jgi:multidrug efflux pump subunit AcrB